MYKERILQKTTSHFMLLGPRGTGKTLWTRRMFSDSVFIDLLDPVVSREYLASPERLLSRVRAESGKTTFVIDEVQKVPALLEVAHMLISENTPHQLIFTGSSARKLRRGNVNLLAGRALLRTMHPYMACEMGDDFRLDRALEIGTIPVVVDADSPREALLAYNALYINEEVKAEGLVRNAESFARFLEAISFSQGSVLNISNIAADSSVSRKTVEGFVQILEDILLAFRLPVFTKHAQRQLVAHPKFYFFDVGVYKANRRVGPLDDSTSLDGIALESLVAQHLRAWCDYSDGDHRLYYWRTKSHMEIDFVVYGSTGPWAIEVSRSRTIRRPDLRALREFRSDYKGAHCLYVYGGSEKLLIDDVLCLPAETFLRELDPRKHPLYAMPYLT